jgi:hypothetical protein
MQEQMRDTGRQCSTAPHVTLSNSLLVGMAVQRSKRHVAQSVGLQLVLAEEAPDLPQRQHERGSASRDLSSSFPACTRISRLACLESKRPAGQGGSRNRPHIRRMVLLP